MGEDFGIAARIEEYPKPPNIEEIKAAARLEAIEENLVQLSKNSKSETPRYGEINDLLQIIRGAIYIALDNEAGIIEDGDEEIVNSILKDVYSRVEELKTDRLSAGKHNHLIH